jgi:hypothetical protein
MRDKALVLIQRLPPPAYARTREGFLCEETDVFAGRHGAMNEAGSSLPIAGATLMR